MSDHRAGHQLTLLQGANAFFSSLVQVQSKRLRQTSTEITMPDASAFRVPKKILAGKGVSS